MTSAQRMNALDAARRASARSTGAVHFEMKRGLSSLASIAGIAPIVGVLGYLRGLVSSVETASGREMSAILARLNWSLAESLIPIEVGLFVALFGYFEHQYFAAKLGRFEAEMEDASLHLLLQLGSASHPPSTGV